VFSRGTAVLALLGLLAACGSLPRPFEGNPGANATRLAQPPPSRLAVLPPDGALLTDEGGHALAEALAKALLDKEVPATAEPAMRSDWKLVITAETRGHMVVPFYGVKNPAGVDQGSAEGPPVGAAAWAAADSATMNQVAQDAAPKLATLLTNIEAARQESDPNSLLNRPARVAFSGVTGAPGDGDRSLAMQMRTELPKLGQVLQETTEGADFTLAGVVATTPVAGDQVRVEIEWIVTDAHGKEAGKVTQLNNVPRGTLDGYWGDVAAVVAKEAAGGVRDVITNQTGARR
jgi:hypothetical protein